MELLQPADFREALEARGAHPGAVPLWGGTDVMVDLNFGRQRPEAILDLTRVSALTEWEEQPGGVLRIGAGVSYTRVIAELGDRLPGLAAASRTGRRPPRARAAPRRSATEARSAATSAPPRRPGTPFRPSTPPAPRSSSPPPAG